MDDFPESSPDCSRGQTEEEDFGRFFEKLANLVPNVNYGCDDSSLDGDGHHQTHCFDLLEKNISSKPSSSVNDTMSNNFKNKNVSLNINSCPNILNTHNNLVYIENSGNKLQGVDLNDSPSNSPSVWHGNCKTTENRTCHVIKVCRNNRNRSAPYRLGNNTTKVQHSSSCDKQSSHHRYRKGHSSSPQIDNNNRLDLLTDVIEYIHNLKSLLQTAQSRSLEAPAPLEHDTLLYPDQLDTHRLQPNHPKTEQQHITDTAQPLRPIERNFPILDKSISPSADTTGNNYQLASNVPVDRAMEILEYKTGAITLTA